MRLIVGLIAVAFTAGCASPRYEIVPVDSKEVILLDKTTGETWLRDYAQVGDDFYPYWKPLGHKRPTTQPG